MWISFELVVDYMFVVLHPEEFYCELALYLKKLLIQVVLIHFPLISAL